MNPEKTKTTTICTNCGGQLEIDATQETIECPYCGTDYSVSDLLNDSDAVKIEKIKSKTQKDIEMGKLEHKKEEAKTQEEKDSINAFKKSKFSKVLIVFAIFGLLCATIAFSNGKIISGIVAAIMALLFIGSWLMGMKIIKEPKHGIRVIAAIIAFVLIIPYFGFYGVNANNAKKFAWSDIELCEVLPEPDSNIGKITSNSETSLIMSVYKISKTEYKEYLKKCQDMGFTVDAEKSENHYSAFNQDGYKLSLQYYESKKELHITLDAPMEMSEIQWPNSVIAKLLPVPKSNIGKISWEYSDRFLIKVGNTTKDDYNAYVNSCSEKGFNVDYDKGDDYYRADDNNGNHISLKYEGNNIMSVEAEASSELGESSEEPAEETAEDTDANEPEEATDEKEAEEAPDTASNDEANSDTASGDIGSDFKAAMDSYEKFFDEYVAIMKKYKENPSDLSILANYTKYMGQYAQMMEDFDNWKSEDMNTAEAAYYLDVQNRINKKLLEVAQ